MYPQPGSLLLRHPLTALRSIAGIPKTAAAMRRCFRPPVRNPNDLNNGFAFFDVPALNLKRMMTAAKQWEVTLNDLLLALLMKCISPVAAGRFQSRKRKKIGLGCIVNLRKELGFGSQPVFGLFLGSFVVAHEAPDSASLKSLARDVSAQTREIKKRRVPLGTAVELAFGRVSFFLASRPSGKRNYTRRIIRCGAASRI